MAGQFRQATSFRVDFRELDRGLVAVHTRATARREAARRSISGR